eukprot:CAMPEP_0184336256 /NCGR_PEP_ID=MMETSP1089-20130417/4618_1 /TAXON_ID=38269 ORGANISM="Gloeochaete wittrockiana, Strain SAG46.84" /NCGR_SAMPLE_ID=MMETSP1089 /ASSEMBLY_ACC=CAM_ASM_000445 /LENGTH=580 /DNA_ID=CAMNT_0026661229 /DNA_START=24 /DNA_END=1766 /DNA_ORIENTATION=+
MVKFAYTVAQVSRVDCHTVADWQLGSRKQSSSCARSKFLRDARFTGPCRKPKRIFSIFSSKTGQVVSSEVDFVKFEVIPPNRPKVVIVGAGWAGLSALYHLSKQKGYDVTLLEAGKAVGGLVAGWREGRKPVEAGIHGFWQQYHNIFALFDEIGISPLTDLADVSQYSPQGLEAIWPVFEKQQPLLPAPFGSLAYTQFLNLPVQERMKALGLLFPVLDFDYSDEGWKRYDKISARDLFKQFGVSERLIQEAFDPMLLTGLFAPAELCSSAAATGMAYFFVLGHQRSFDVRWCRGTVAEKIFQPWLSRIDHYGGQVETGARVSDVTLGPRNTVTEVVCEDGRRFPADAVVFATGISALQKIVTSSPALQSRSEFLDVMNLRAVDAVAVRLWFDRKVYVPRAANACYGFDPTVGWTFFDLTSLHDEYRDAEGSVIEADFYNCSQFLPMSDQAITARVHRYLEKCVPGFREANVIDSTILRLPRAVSHFFPGSYQHIPKAETSFSNVFLAGDWIKDNEHGSWSQEKAYVTGLKASNLVINKLGQGDPARILPVEPDEPHIELGRNALKSLRNLSSSINLPLPF